MTFVKALKCRECGRSYKKEAIYVCEFCFGSLEVDYDYDGIKEKLSRELIESRPQTMWRYAELLPLDKPHTSGYVTGFTPLIPAENLAKRLGMKKVWIKNDAVCHPTLSFKDRVVGVALSKARELGFDTVACASTGNLANSVAANAAIGKQKSYVFIPSDLELSKVVGTLIYHPNLVKVDGNYDEVNRLCAEVAGKYKWAFVNINMRSYYAEGSKTHGFEIVEQLGWKYPDNIVVPIASGSLMSKIWKSFKEFQKVGLMKGDIPTKFFGAQAEGCSPVVTAIKDGVDIVKPVKPKTICKSLAIGNPADGYYAIDTMRQTGGWGENPTDEEIVDAILLLAEEEGVFTETAGGTTMAAALRLIKSGKIKKDESVVICITGNGLKTSEVVTEKLIKPMHIKPSLASFEDALKAHHKK